MKKILSLFIVVVMLLNFTIIINADDGKDGALSFEQKLKEKYGESKSDSFVSCEGDKLYDYPNHIFGILAVYPIGLSSDDVMSYLVLRVNKTEYNRGEILAEIYSENDVTTAKADELIFNISYCGDLFGYTYYNENLGKNCIVVDYRDVGAYTGVDVRGVKIFTYSEDSISLYKSFENVPISGMPKVDFESELRNVGAPYARYCTQGELVLSDIEYISLWEVEHTITTFAPDGVSLSYIDRTHHLTMKSFEIENEKENINDETDTFDTENNETFETKDGSNTIKDKNDNVDDDRESDDDSNEDNSTIKIVAICGGILISVVCVVCAVAAIFKKKSKANKYAPELSNSAVQNIQVVYCSNCGQPNTPDYQFCSSCGAKRQY